MPVEQHPVAIRPARSNDALSLSVLGMQVYLDTYAINGIRDAIARDVLSSFPEQAFVVALHDPKRQIWVAEREGHLIGFAELSLGATHELVQSQAQSELLRLYVQEPFTARKVGTQLLLRAELAAQAAGTQTLWLRLWSGNARAMAFYRRGRYEDKGETFYLVESERIPNRVYSKRLDSSAA